MKYQHILIDGQNLLVRAAYSYQLSIVEDDEIVPTGAIFGFLQMVLSTWRKYASSTCQVTICWDAGYDHRLALYPEYKANRRKPRDPNEEVSEQFLTLSAQGTALRKILSAAGWHQARAPGFEADDVLATLAKRFATPGNQVAIYTMDQDLHQCVSDQIHVVSENGGREKTWTSQEVLEKWALPPERVAEAKALIGDSGDNIPGCPGCGMGWAQKILQDRSLKKVLEFSGEGLILHGEFQGKPWKAPTMTKKIAENEGLILTSWELSKVVFDSPVTITQEKPNQDLLKSFLFRLKFHSLLEEEALQNMIKISASEGRPPEADAPEPKSLDEILGLDL